MENFPHMTLLAMKIIYISLILALVGCAESETDYESAMFPVKNMKAQEFYDNMTQIEFLQSIEKGDIGSMRRLLENGVDINGEGRHGMRPIFWALIKRNVKSFEFLLKNGADPNSVADKREDKKSPATVIELAVVLEDSNYLRLLLEYGADPNTAVHYGKRTIIYEAIIHNRFESLGLLTDAGANVNHQDISGSTPMIVAADIIRYDMVYFLLKKGADPKIKDRWDHDLSAILMDQGKRGFSPRHPDYDALVISYNKIIKILKDQNLIEATWEP